MHDYYPEGWRNASVEEKQRLRELWEKNLIIELFDIGKHKSQARKYPIYGSDYFWTVNVMKDGLVHTKLKEGENEHILYSWSSIEYVDVSKGPFLIRSTSTGQEITLLPNIHPEDLASLKDKWPIYVARGDIPQSVGFTPGRLDTSGIAASPPNGGRKRGTSPITFLAVLLAIFAGVPFFKGGGSLAAAALPGLATIAPASVDLAIRNNPQWPAATKFRLVGGAAAMNATPTIALTGIFGLQQNSAVSLWFIPIYWAETLGDRDWQVKTLADMIANNENHPPAPN